MSQSPNDNSPPAGSIQLLTPGEVAALYRVDPKTTVRWADAGKFTTVRTPGGHRRFLADEVFANLGQGVTRQAQP